MGDIYACMVVPSLGSQVGRLQNILINYECLLNFGAIFSMLRAGINALDVYPFPGCGSLYLGVDLPWVIPRFPQFFPCTESLGHALRHMAQPHEQLFPIEQ